MRLIRFSVLLAVIATACASQQVPIPANGGHHYGSAGGTRFCVAPLNVVTGNNATVTIFDTTTQAVFVNTGVERLVVSMFFDQGVTVNYQVKARGSSTWRTINGNGSGDSVSASTFTAIDYRIIGFDNRIQVVTGSTGPTTAEIDICPAYDAPASM